MQSACTILYCWLWPLWVYNIFPHYLITGTIIGKKLLGIECVLWFPLQYLSETYLIVRRIQRPIIISIHMFHVKYPLFLSDFKQIWILLKEFWKILIYQISWRSVQWKQTCSMWMGGQRGGHDMAWIDSSRKLLNLKCTHITSTEKMAWPYANPGNPMYTSLRKGDIHLKHNSLTSTIACITPTCTISPSHICSCPPCGLLPSTACFSTPPPPILSPSFRSAQAIFEPNLFPYKYPQHSQPQSFFIPICLWRWNRQRVLKHWHIKFRCRGITQKKAHNRHDKTNTHFLLFYEYA